MAVNFTVSPSSGLALATEFTFKDTSVLPHSIVYRSWGFDDTTFASSVTSVVHTFDFAKTYNITLKLIDNTGTTFTLTTALKVDSYLNEAIKFIDPGLFVVEKGQLQKTPLRIEISAVDIADCSVDQGNRGFDGPPCGHYVNLYSQFSKSTPFVPSISANRWSSLEPYWRFLDLDYNVVENIKTTDTVIYVEGSAVGVTGFAEFYYVDDSASDAPLILWATLQTSAVNFHMDDDLGDFPSFTNSKVNAAIPYYVDGIDPSYLGIGEDVFRDLYPVKWQNGSIPHLLTVRGRAVSKMDVEDPGEAVVYDVGPSHSVFSTALSGEVGFSVLSEILGCEPSTYTFDTADTSKKIDHGFLRGNVTTTCSAVSAAIHSTTVIAYGGNPRMTPYTWIGNPKNLSIAQFHLPPKIPASYPSTVIRPISSEYIISVPGVGSVLPGAPPFYSTIPTLYQVNTTPTSAVSGSAFAGIYGFAVDPAYNVWVTDADLDRVYKLDADRNLKQTIQMQLGSTPGSICLDGDLNVYIGLHDASKIAKLDKFGNPLDELFLPPLVDINSSSLFSDTRKLSGAYEEVEDLGTVVTAKPIAVETDSNNNVWAIFASATFNALVQFDSGGVYKQHIPFKAPYQPVDLIVDTWDGDAIWVSVPIAWGFGGEIRKYTTTGRLVSSIRSFYQPYTLAQDLSGNIWCTYGFDRVGKYNIKTNQTTTWVISAGLGQAPGEPPPPEPPPSSVAAPIITPASGTYHEETLRVLMRSSTPGAYISYTTDGSTPTRTHGTITPTNFVAVILHGPMAFTIKAMAFWPGVETLNSTVTTANYILDNIIPVPEPDFNPHGGTYLNYFLFVEMFTSNEDAWLSYTTDGTDPSPTHGSIVQSNGAGIRLLARHNELTTITLKAMGFIDGNPARNSPIHSEDYTLTASDPDPPPGVLPPPTFHPGSGEYDVGRLLVEISDVISDAWMSYTTDGSTPTQTHGNIVRASRFNFSIGIGTYTIKAVAFLNGVPTSTSPVNSVNYVVRGRPRGPEEPGIEELTTYVDYAEAVDQPAPGPGPNPNPPNPIPLITEHPPTSGLWFDPSINPDFSRLQGIACDSQNRIWTIDSEDNEVYLIGSPSTIPGYPPSAYQPPRPPPGNMPKPSLTPDGGTYPVTSLFVQISSVTAGTYISYTTDGTYPSRSHGIIIPRQGTGLRLRGPITTTINAMDFDPNDTHRNSSIATETYILSGGDQIEAPGIINEKNVLLPFNYSALDTTVKTPINTERQPPGESGYAIYNFKILPDANIEVFDDTGDGSEYLAASAIQESAQSFGDWTGYKWHQKYAGYQIGRKRFRTISGQSAPFQLYAFVNPYDIRKFNESFDIIKYIKELPMPERLAQNHILFDKFLGYSIGGLETNDQGVGKAIYERISNFANNHSDIETCGVNMLYSIAESMGVSLDNYNLAYPPELRRLLDLLSISHTKLWGTRSKNAKKFKDDFSCCTNCKPVNKGAELDFATAQVTVGTPIVAKDKYSDTYWLIPIFRQLSGVDIHDDHDFHHNFPTLSGIGVNTLPNSYPLSALQSAELKTPLSSWYVFYTYIPTFDNIQVEGVINWEDPYTTLEETNSAVGDWIGNLNIFGDNGIMEMIFNYQLHRGLGLIKDE